MRKKRRRKEGRVFKPSVSHIHIGIITKYLFGGQGYLSMSNCSIKEAIKKSKPHMIIIVLHSQNKRSYISMLPCSIKKSLLIQYLSKFSWLSFSLLYS